MHKLTLRQIYNYGMILLGGLIVLVQVGYYIFISSVIRQNNLQTAGFISDHLQSELSRELTSVDIAINYFDQNEEIRTFLSVDNAKIRYQTDTNIENLMRTILYEQKMIDTILVYDRDGHRYQYGNSVSLDISRQLYESYTGLPRGTHFFTDISGSPQFCACLPLFDIDNRMRLTRLGTILVLCSTSAIDYYFDSYSASSGLAIYLTSQDNQILFTNQPFSDAESFDPEFLDSSSNVVLADTELIPGFHLYVLQNTAELIPFRVLFFLISTAILLIYTLFILTTRQSMLRMIFHPINALISAVDQTGSTMKERIELPASVYKTVQIEKLTDAVNEMLSRIDSYSHRAFENQQALYESALREAKYESYMLRKQIDVHFVFNTLNSIKSLAEESDQNEISQISDGLGMLLRYAYTPNDSINFFDEIQILEQYVYIMNIRFNHQFDVSFDADDTLCSYTILRQLLQPLLENSMTHAVFADGRLLHISLLAEEKDGGLQITIKDDGIGMSSDRLSHIQRKLELNEDDFSTAGITMFNVNRRIRLHYGEAYGLSIDSEEGRGTVVTLHLPLVEDGAFPPSST